MDALSYYSVKSVELEDIRRCITQAGYQASYQNDHGANKPRLYVPFNTQNPSETMAYWRWENLEIGWSDIDIEEQRVIKPIWKDVKTVYTIWYPMTEMKAFGQMIQKVFLCFGGYVFFEYILYDKNNILTIIDNVPEPPPELRDD